MDDGISERSVCVDSERTSYTGRPGEFKFHPSPASTMFTALLTLSLFTAPLPAHLTISQSSPKTLTNTITKTSFCCDFTTPLSSRSTLLLKSVGYGRTIIDLTAGIGNDSFLLTTCYNRVISVERNLHLFSLLRDGVQRAKLDSRWTVHNKNSIEFLSSHSHHEVDTVYIDTMFVPRKKNRASAKAGMQLVRDVLEGGNGNNNDDSLVLFEAARKLGCKVVVKRGKADAAFAKPSYVIGAKNRVRFDVFQ